MTTTRAAMTAGAAAAAYLVVVRPWMLSWGATAEEGRGTLPGDDVVAAARLSATRGVDIAAASSAVWPWLVALGYGPERAGFYSYDWLENLIGLDIHSASRISPRPLPVEVGDRIPFGADTDFRVEEVDAGSALVLHVRMHPFTGRDVLDRPSRLWLDWTWAFVLRPRGQESRLIVRTRGAWSHRWVGRLMQPLLEPVHFLMERRMLLGIRERAERRGEPVRSSVSADRGARPGAAGAATRSRFPPGSPRPAGAAEEAAVPDRP